MWLWKNKENTDNVDIEIIQEFQEIYVKKDDNKDKEKENKEEQQINCFSFTLGLFVGIFVFYLKTKIK